MSDPFFYRSEDMHLYKILMQKDNEYAICELLGQRSFAHFLEMNKGQNVFDLPYV